MLTGCWRYKFAQNIVIAWHLFYRSGILTVPYMSTLTSSSSVAHMCQKVCQSCLVQCCVAVDGTLMCRCADIIIFVQHKNYCSALLVICFMFPLSLHLHVIIGAWKMLQTVLMLVECGSRLKQSSSLKHVFLVFISVTETGHCPRSTCALLLISKWFEHACGLIFRTGTYYEFVLSHFAPCANDVKMNVQIKCVPCIVNGTRSVTSIVFYLCFNFPHIVLAIYFFFSCQALAFVKHLVWNISRMHRFHVLCTNSLMVKLLIFTKDIGVCHELV